MALTTALVQEKFRQIRTAVPGATVQVRHGDGGTVYTGIRTTLESGLTVSQRGALHGGAGAVRLDVSELTPPHPKAGDSIEVREVVDDEWAERAVIDVRYDQVRGTMLMRYGEKYG